ncbi:MAG: efflux RND transporter periplasmic adaptor subunit [Verrucomicrobiales bacterium]
MRRIHLPPFISLTLLLAAGISPAAEEAIDPKRMANTVVLDETGVQNLGIETTMVEEADFEVSIFALGRIEAIPANRAAVSSRIEGRILELSATLGDSVEKDAPIAKIESRQPGDPPPTITLSAPIGGLVTRSDARLGDPVDPNSPLLEIIDLGEVYAVARVPEHQAGKMQPGTVAHIRVSALPDEAFDGELLRFGTEANRESGTLDAVFRLPNPSGKLRPGMRAEFSVVLDYREGVMAVPREALQGSPADRFVYVADFDLENAYVKSPVVVGQQNDQMVEIVSGLFPADEVVTSGAYSLAFAGKGSVSLKEALDAAHGHEHNADGSEMTAAQKAARDAEMGGGDHGHGHGSSTLTYFFMASTGVLLALLILQSFKNRRPAEAEPLNS